MIDIRAELEEVRNNFISIYDFISLAKNVTGEDEPLVCQWLLKRVKEKITKDATINICTMNQFHEIEYAFELVDEDFQFLSQKLCKVIEKGCLPIGPEDVPFELDDWGDNSFFDHGFKKIELDVFFPELKEHLYPAKAMAENLNFVSFDKTSSHVNTSSSVKSAITSTQSTDSDFSGKETALMLIAGLAVALEKTSERFRRGGKMNKSAVLGGAESAINSYGNGVNVTNRALRDWLNLALKMHASKLES